MIGRTISHYKILSQLGEGGMGVVYQAQDTKLERTVALKFLASHLVQDGELRKRFEREAKAAASLNHPNICTVHEIDAAGGKTFISMALIEGEPLDERIERGPLKVAEAVDIALQIAKGLEAAHEKGVVHRDVKPANVMVDEKGHVTVMDFGLALLTEGSKLTKLDTTVGTVAYMSPEQAQGGAVDHRTDVWALGCVLYEMVSGQRPFLGQYDQALLYEIVHEEPEPLTGLRTGVPVELELLVDKCLAKDSGQRYQSTADLIVDLESLCEKLKSGRSTILKMASHPHGQSVGTQHAAPAPPDAAPPNEPSLRRKLQLALALAATMTVAFLAVSFIRFPQSSAERSVRRWSFSPEDLSIGRGSVALSPNGRHIAYVAGSGNPKLLVRDIDRLEPRELAGAGEGRQPFWSPDSRFIVFAVGSELKKISVQGGPSVTLCPLPGGTFIGGSWGPDGESVLFSGGGLPPRIYEVSARGGQPRLLFEPEEEARGLGIARPHVLPPEAGAGSLLMAVGSADDSTIVLKNLETGESRVLADGNRPIFSSSGHIVYEWQEGLWALPFSLDALEPIGQAFPIAENRNFPSVAKDGTLVSIELPGGGETRLTWRDRAGTRLGEIGQPQDDIRYPVLSPDGRRVAVRADEDGNVDIWVHEVERPMKRRLTFDAATDTRPQWSPSGLEITFQSQRGGSYDLYHQAADGASKPELLVSAKGREHAYGWSRDGDYLLYATQAEGQTDLRYLERKDEGEGYESVLFLASPFSERAPNLSPDGRFLAYCSNDTGQDEVYVRPFPSGDGQWQASTNGGCQPRWSRDGKELFYVEGETLTAVELTTSPNFVAISTTPLFSDPHLTARSPSQVTYDVSADGRFVLVDSAESPESKPAAIHVVENWYEEFRDREQD